MEQVSVVKKINFSDVNKFFLTFLIDFQYFFNNFCPASIDSLYPLLTLND